MLKACGLKLTLVAGNISLGSFLDNPNMIKVSVMMLLLFYTNEVTRDSHILFVETLT